MTKRVVIVGAGHAGGTAAAMLRQYGFDGDILMIGDEPLAPYQRPPLSKAWLKGEADGESLLLRPESFYAEKDITHLKGQVTKIVRGDRHVELEDGSSEPYDILILATGARARKIPIPGADLSGILELRNAADADGLKAALTPGKRLAVVGGGYIGLEVAASARALGCEVTVIEREDRVLARVASEPLSHFFEKCHRDQGVTILTGANVAGFEGEGAVSGVKLESGDVVACDIALVGIGAIPNDEMAQDAGLDCAGGIVVDLNAQTADPQVYAIGDVTHRPLPLYDRQMRLESVPNALEQAKQAAAHITGRPEPKPEVPWFWSDQYDLKLQIAGVPFDIDELVIRGDAGAASFAVFHLSEGRVMAVEAVNAAPEFMAGKKMIAAHTVVDPIRLADMSVSMKDLMAG